MKNNKNGWNSEVSWNNPSLRNGVLTNALPYEQPDRKSLREKPFHIAGNVAVTIVKLPVANYRPDNRYQDYVFELSILNNTGGTLKVYMADSDGNVDRYTEMQAGGPGIVYDRLDWYEVAGGIYVESTTAGNAWLSLRTIRVLPNTERSNFID